MRHAMAIHAQCGIEGALDAKVAVHDVWDAYHVLHFVDARLAVDTSQYRRPSTSLQNHHHLRRRDLSDPLPSSSHIPQTLCAPPLSPEFGTGLADRPRNDLRVVLIATHRIRYG